MSGEFERIAEIQRRLQARGAANGAEVLLGIGDDAAVLAASPHLQVLSVDAQVEGVHFRDDLLSAQDIGHRALSAALSDLAAMGARPRGALLSLIAPTALPDARLYAIVDGMAEAAGEYGCPVIGGNLAAGAQLSVTTTVVGEIERAGLRRDGARNGDGLFVVGPLGGAALGLQALLHARPELAPEAVRAWRRPRAQLAAGRALLAAQPRASAAIDVSDGFLQDLTHLAQDSGVGFDVELSRLPLHAEVATAAPALGLEPLQLALAGGEDYALLFTRNADSRDAEGGLPGVRVGRATAQPGIRLYAADGSPVSPPRSLGFDHFQGTGPRGGA